jgi:hypothetical protein
VFGMLDYRAHKLYWLLALPFRIIVKVLFFAVVFIAIIFAQSTSYIKPIKIVIAYAGVEAGLILLSLIWWPVTSAFNRVFFFLIDVVPAHGANMEEAHAIVLTGRTYELLKKFENDIQNWSYDDTREFVSRLNWRVRLFFPVMQRTARLVQELKLIHEETGKQPSDIGRSEIAKIRNELPNGKISWPERAIGTQWSFNALLALSIIVVAFGIVLS